MVTKAHESVLASLLQAFREQSVAVSGERVKYTWKTREGGGRDEGGLELVFFFFFANFSSPLYCLNAWNRLPTNVNYFRRFMVGNYYKDIARI